MDRSAKASAFAKLRRDKPRDDGVAMVATRPLTPVANDSGVIASITRTSHESLLGAPFAREESLNAHAMHSEESL
ncbi:hypothetical protein [uncultured Bradyrhizobium sp.]|uniref:hypothetical protein n=1 Tax=Bradyrhizobium sp. TaxID=376 RepID=UPI00262F6898|nr:hypothetical protein [uncultured Bradyrhizobium sp.]